MLTTNSNTPGRQGDGISTENVNKLGIVDSSTNDHIYHGQVAEQM
jgi:hypothetical protein